MIRVLPVWSFLDECDWVAANLKSDPDLVANVFRDLCGTVVGQNRFDLVANLSWQWHRTLTRLLEEFVEEFGCPLGTFVSEDDRLRSGSRIGDYSFLVKPIERIPIVRLPSAGNTAVSETRQMKKGEHRIVDFVIVYFHFRFLSISRRRGMTHNV
jgi:hypothetical protein